MPTMLPINQISRHICKYSTSPHLECSNDRILLLDVSFNFYSSRFTKFESVFRLPLLRCCRVTPGLRNGSHSYIVGVGKDSEMRNDYKQQHTFHPPKRSKQRPIATIP